MYGDYYNPYNNYSSNNQWQNPINRNHKSKWQEWSRSLSDDA